MWFWNTLLRTTGCKGQEGKFEVLKRVGKNVKDQQRAGCGCVCVGGTSTGDIFNGNHLR